MKKGTDDMWTTSRFLHALDEEVRILAGAGRSGAAAAAGVPLTGFAGRKWSRRRRVGIGTYGKRTGLQKPVLLIGWRLVLGLVYRCIKKL